MVGMTSDVKVVKLVSSAQKIFISFNELESVSLFMLLLLESKAPMGGWSAHIVIHKQWNKFHTCVILEYRNFWFYYCNTMECSSFILGIQYFYRHVIYIVACTYFICQTSKINNHLIIYDSRWNVVVLLNLYHKIKY